MPAEQEERTIREAVGVFDSPDKLASGGTLALVIAAAALAGGVGGLFGSLLAKSVGDHHAQYLQEQLDHGGLLLWVRTRTAEHEQRASRILSGHSGRDVHVHTLPVPR